MSLIICLMTSRYASGEGAWEERLQKYLAGSMGAMPAALDSIVRRDAAVALHLKKFFKDLSVDKSVPYPAVLLDQALGHEI
jgi:hypothetical protein